MLQPDKRENGNLHFLLYLVIIPSWITATDKVADKACKEKLGTQYHCNESYKEGSVIGEQVTIILFETKSKYETNS